MTNLYGKNLPYTYFNEILPKHSGSSDLYLLSVMLSGCWRVIASPAHWQVRYPFLVGGLTETLQVKCLVHCKTTRKCIQWDLNQGFFTCWWNNYAYWLKIPQFTLRKPYIRIRKSWLTLHQYMLFYFLSNCKNSLSFVFSFLDGRVLQIMNLWPPKF